MKKIKKLPDKVEIPELLDKIAELIDATNHILKVLHLVVNKYNEVAKNINILKRNLQEFIKKGSSKKIIKP